MLPAAGALAAQLVAVVAVEHQPRSARKRQDRRDQEPQEDRGALDPGDDRTGQAEPEAEGEVDHPPSVPPGRGVSRARASDARSAELGTLAAFEAELGEAETADTGGRGPVTGRGRRRHEDQAASRGGGGHDSIVPGISASPPWTVDPIFTRRDSTPWTNAPPRRRPGAPPSSAGRSGLARRRRTRQRAPLNARLATVAKPSSSSRSASSRCATRSPEGSAGSGTLTQQQNTRRPPGRTSTAPASPTQPHAERAALGHQARPRVQLARVVADQVAEQPEPTRARPPRSAARLRPAARSRRGARRAPGSPTRGRAARSDRERQRLERQQQPRGAEERHRVRDRGDRPRCARARSAGARRPAGASRPRSVSGGRPAGRRYGHPPAIGRRRITRSASRGSSRDLLGPALALGAHDGVVAGVELHAELRHCASTASASPAVHSASVVCPVGPCG